MSGTPEKPLSILLAGGNSKSGMALREMVRGNSEFNLTSMVRKPAPSTAGDRIVAVSDYFDPPAKLLSDAQIVINFAGVTEGKSDGDFYAANVSGPAQLTLKSRDAGVRHFIHLSSLSVYGRAPRVGRQTAEAPISSYGRSKREGDEALKQLATDRFAVTLLRAPAIYGVGGRSKLRSLAKAMSMLGYFPVPRTIGQRSVLHRRNLAAAALEIAVQGLGGIQFAADPEPLTLRKVAEALSDDRTRPVRIVSFPDSAFSPLRRFSPDLYFSLYGDSLIAPTDCVDLSRFAAISLREGLKDLLR